MKPSLALAMIALVVALLAIPAPAEAQAAGNAFCPVCGKTADPNVSFQFGRKTIFFADETCRDAFRKSPYKYFKKMRAAEKAAKVSKCDTCPSKATCATKTCETPKDTKKYSKKYADKHSKKYSKKYAKKYAKKAHGSTCTKGECKLDPKEVRACKSKCKAICRKLCGRKCCGKCKKACDEVWAECKTKKAACCGTCKGDKTKCTATKGKCATCNCGKKPMRLSRKEVASCKAECKAICRKLCGRKCCGKCKKACDKVWIDCKTKKAACCGTCKGDATKCTATKCATCPRKAACKADAMKKAPCCGTCKK